MNLGNFNIPKDFVLSPIVTQFRLLGVTRLPKQEITICTFRITKAKGLYARFVLQANKYRLN